MSTYDKLDTINDSLNNIKTAIIAKGQTPSGDITTYAAAIENIDGGASSRFGLTLDNFIGTVDNNGVLQIGSSVQNIVFTGVEDIGNHVLDGTFNFNITGTVSFPDLTDVSGDYALCNTFNGKTISSVDLSSLTTVSGYGAFSYAFNGCDNLTSVDLSSLTTVSGSSAFDSAFQNCAFSGTLDLSALTTVGAYGFVVAFPGNHLTSVDLSSLTTISGREAFGGCFHDNPVTTVDTSSLSYIAPGGLSYAFGRLRDSNGQHTLVSLSFPALKSNSFESGDETAFDYMLYDLDEDFHQENVTVHFPSNLQAIIGNWQSVIDGFGGTNTTVLFDLPSTENVNQGSGSATEAEPDSTDPVIIPEPDDDEIDWEQ